MSKENRDINAQVNAEIAKARRSSPPPPAIPPEVERQQRERFARMKRLGESLGTSPNVGPRPGYDPLQNGPRR